MDSEKEVKYISKRSLADLPNVRSEKYVDTIFITRTGDAAILTWWPLLEKWDIYIGSEK